MFSQILRFEMPNWLFNQVRKIMLQGTPRHEEVLLRRAAIIVCMLLGIASVATPADCQSIESQISSTPKWSTPLTGGEVLGPVNEAALSHWWTVFNDPILTSLEERALKSNLDLRAALSRIEQARANRQSASGSLFPSVTFTGSASGARASTQNGADVTHGNTAEFDVSWEPDFFHALRKNVDAYGVDIQTAQENLRATMVTLTAEVAVDYVNLR
jgi:outer membrane protein TolC